VHEAQSLEQPKATQKDADHADDEDDGSHVSRPGPEGRTPGKRPRFHRDTSHRRIANKE
jgi:hypothetical protein